MTQSYHHGALRQALLDAAETILDRDGIEALTLRAAAREAGVSHGAPAHHFRDITGLLTELAAMGFLRLRDALQAASDETDDPAGYVPALGRAYVGFARAHPGIFLLMFRSERLDWSAPSLDLAGPAAFAFLLREERGDGVAGYAADMPDLVRATTRWSLVHGLATLVVDGRLSAMTQMIPHADLDVLIETVLAKGLAP